MALQIPVAATGLGQGWGPTTYTSEPAMYGYLGRAWWNYPGYPFRFYRYFHPGIDIPAPLGTPIVASERGIISALGPNGVSGLRYNIRIRPSPLVLYVGGHLSSIGVNPRTKRTWALGDKILRGEVIGKVGHSGVASGDHLHFGVQIGNMLYNPTLFFPGGYNANDPRIAPYY